MPSPVPRCHAAPACSARKEGRSDERAPQRRGPASAGSAVPDLRVHRQQCAGDGPAALLAPAVLAWRRSGQAPPRCPPAPAAPRPPAGPAPWHGVTLCCRAASGRRCRPRHETRPRERSPAPAALASTPPAAPADGPDRRARSEPGAAGPDAAAAGRSAGGPGTGGPRLRERRGGHLAPPARCPAVALRWTSTAGLTGTRTHPLPAGPLKAAVPDAPSQRPPRPPARESPPVLRRTAARDCPCHPGDAAPASVADGLRRRPAAARPQHPARPGTVPGHARDPLSASSSASTACWTASGCALTAAADRAAAGSEPGASQSFRCYCLGRIGSGLWC